MSFNYKSYDGLALSELIKKKEVKQSEVIEAAIETIEQKNPKLNAIINKFYEDGKRPIVNKQGGLFKGVPMLLKDITQEMEGENISSGSRLFQSYKAKEDSEFVLRLRETGAVFLGYTNVPEFALMGITEPKQYGATRN